MIVEVKNDQMTPVQRAYLATQKLGRLATIDASGVPQNNPVGFRVNHDGTIDIGGYGMEKSRKYRNVAINDKVAFVVDDVVLDPWTARFVEMRGVAIQIPDGTPPFEGQSTALIRIQPRQIISFGLGEETAG